MINTHGLTKTQVWLSREIYQYWKDFASEIAPIHDFQEFINFCLEEHYIKTVWERLNEDQQNEVFNVVENATYEPTRDDYESDSRYDAWKDGDR